MTGPRALRATAPVGPRTAFCGHCAQAPPGGRAPEVGSRVCLACGLGLLLEAPPALVPRAHEAFLVSDRSLTVHALSRRAEVLLGLREIDALGARVTDLLVPPDAEAAGPHRLGTLLAAAAAGSGDVGRTALRPAGEFGVRFSARVGPCGWAGAASGALVVLDLG